MSREEQDELAKKAGRILEKWRQLPADQQLKGLRQKGVIDENGQVLVPRGVAPRPEQDSSHSAG